MKRRDSTVSGNSTELQSLMSSDTQASLQSVGEETPAVDVLIDKFDVPKVGLCWPPMFCHPAAFMTCECANLQVHQAHHIIWLRAPDKQAWLQGAAAPMFPFEDESDQEEWDEFGAALRPGEFASQQALLPGRLAFHAICQLCRLLAFPGPR